MQYSGKNPQKNSSVSCGCELGTFAAATMWRRCERFLSMQIPPQKESVGAGGVVKWKEVLITVHGLYFAGLRS
jgi:hypothetical protein